MQPCLQAGAGGLSDTEGWLGFMLAVITMLATVVNFVSLQAYRHFGFTATQLQVRGTGY